jgi:hypothetical protein
MPTMIVTKQLTAPVDALWELLADFADVSWLPGQPDVRIDGEGPGMRRTISGSGGDPIIETLLWTRPQERALSYEIENNPLPVKRFRAVITVTPANGTDPSPGSALTWDVDYEPSGDDAAARHAIESVYGMMAGWLQDAVTGAKPSG